MAICIENDIIIVSSNEMTTKWVKSGKVEDTRSLLIVFTQCRRGEQTDVMGRLKFGADGR